LLWERGVEKEVEGVEEGDSGIKRVILGVEM
jgi:hypothetical protein